MRTDPGPTADPAPDPADPAPDRDDDRDHDRDPDGAGDLAGQVVLVTGGTGQVGWGIAHAAADAGAHVLLPSRRADGVDALAEEFGDATVLHLDPGSPDAADDLEAAIADAGGLHHVAAPMGAWWQKGPALDQETSELSGLLQTHALAQHVLARTTVPHLRRSAGSLTIVTGAVGEQVGRDTGLLYVAVNAQYALADVLRADHRDDDVRVNEFRISVRVERDPREGVVPSRTVGRAVVDLMAGDRASERVRYEG